MGGHIWRPILRKVCERNLLLMVWVQKNSTARWLEKVAMKEFLCGLTTARWLEKVAMKEFPCGLTTARWLEKVVMKEFLCGLCIEGVRETFWVGFHKREVIYGDLF